MSNEKQTGVSNLASRLLTQVCESQKPAVKGKWFPIRVRPNLATGEILNIGVGFTIGKTTHVKLLESAEPFKRLYGNKGDDNFSFLIEMVESHFQNKQPKSKSPSPHIIFENGVSAFGDSIEEILDRLYKQMVTLRLVSDKSKETREKNYNTVRVRNIVRKELEGINIDFVERYWYNDTILLSKNDNDRANLQVYLPQEISREALYASVISADYSDVNTITSQLHSSFLELTIAHRVLKKSRGNLFIYRPSTGKKNTMTIIDNEIDRTHYTLNKAMPNTKLEVFDTTEQIAENIIAIAS